MSQPMYDPSSKWILEERAESILWLAGVRSVISCRAKKAEVVQPRKLPDGLLEVRLARDRKTHLVLVEVATYPEERVVQQVSDGLRLVRQARGVLADAVVICLSPRGNYRVAQQTEQTSRLGWSSERLQWKVVELWNLSAEDLLTAPDVGVVLWATLAKYEGPPEVLLQRCRERIEREGGEQRANLLAVAQVFARLHFDKPEWLEILGGRKAMIESPLIQEIVEESERTGQVKLIVYLLKQRFEAINPSIEAGLAHVTTFEGLIRLNVQAVTCTTLQAFEEAMREELPKTQLSTRTTKRKKGG